tara:strand:+ start:1461 stop:1799 length:339 start_codon:yes stop_codon:yes gene_type:complete
MDINYQDKSWRVELPSSPREWRGMVTLFNRFGIPVHDPSFTTNWSYIAVNQASAPNELMRGMHNGLEIISIYEAIVRLTTPAKSEHEIKIDRLQATIDDAAKQILELKQVQK